MGKPRRVRVKVSAKHIEQREPSWKTTRDSRHATTRGVPLHHPARNNPMHVRGAKRKRPRARARRRPRALAARVRHGAGLGHRAARIALLGTSEGALAPFRGEALSGMSAPPCRSGRAGRCPISTKPIPPGHRRPAGGTVGKNGCRAHLHDGRLRGANRQSRHGSPPRWRRFRKKTDSPNRT